MGKRHDLPPGSGDTQREAAANGCCAMFRPAITVLAVTDGGDVASTLTIANITY
jgi:hypothetical protein